jgi:hypothetical protein
MEKEAGPKELGVLEKLIADLSRAVDAFAEHDPGSKKVLDQLSNADPLKFFAAGFHVVATTKSSPGSQYLVVLLAKDKRLGNWLLDPKACTLKEAIAVARVAADTRVHLQATFEMALNKALQNQASAANADRILRNLNLLEAIGSHSCWNSFQVELMAYPDKVVRSKAALLIGRSSKNSDWIVRRLLDRDPRVQANAVESLWGLDGAETKPHLLEALKSKNNRVFGNAAVGLYRLGDPTIIRVLLEATKHPEPLFQLSALWAIGQTQDPRFLPALTLQFKSAQGKLRLALAGAMSRIRQREQSAVKANPLHMDIGPVVMEPDGKRRLVVTLSTRPAKNLSGLKPTEFLIWENGSPVEDYRVRLISPSDHALAGFVAPWFASPGEPLEKAVREGLQQCLGMKRPDDPWRVDRYGLAGTQAADEKPPDESHLPYDDAVITAAMKSAQGCLSDADQLRKIFDLAVPRDRAAANGISAIQRQCKAMIQRPGKRHMIVLLHQLAGPDMQEEATAALLRGFVRDNLVIFHGISLGTGQWPLFRELCLSTPEGSFIETGEPGIVDAFVQTYAMLCNRFEITYSLPVSGIAQAAVKLKVASDRGSAQGEVTLEPPIAPPAEAPAGAEAPSNASTPAVPSAA